MWASTQLPGRRDIENFKGGNIFKRSKSASMFSLLVMIFLSYLKHFSELFVAFFWVICSIFLSYLQHFSELFVDFSELFVNLTDLKFDCTGISLERFYYKSMQCMYGKWIIYGSQFPLSSNFKTIFILVKKAIKIIQFRVLVKSVPSFERFHPQLVWGFFNFDEFLISDKKKFNFRNK